MDIEIYQALAKLATEQLVDHCSGLTTYVEADDRTGISKSRLRKYKAGEKLIMTPAETDFHLIGFLDCIAWMARNGYIDFKKVKEESDIDTYVPDDAPQWEKDFAECIITDADMINEYCSYVICDDFDAK